MGYITGIVLIIIGILASASLIIEKQPSAKKVIDNLVPYQGWIGIFAAFWGIFIVIDALLNIDTISLGVRFFIWWITYLAAGLLEFSLGFLLGYSLISTLLDNNVKAKEKGAKLNEKLISYQRPLGIASIVLGIWVIVSRIILI